ncbi:MAG: hypothetical protein KJ674_03735 [Nanoarchaeota archaeon]|nr:hypothetical protein [Nanoarchaeota archaeon]
MSSISTKSQLWSIDFLLGTFIFILMMVFLYSYVTNLSQTDNNLIRDSEVISNSLLSEGYPQNWDEDNVNKIGLFSNKKLSETKLNNFSQLDYEETKSLFKIFNDYYIYFVDENNEVFVIENIQGVGKSGVNSTNIKEVENPKNIVKTDRIIVYNNTILRMVLHVWD